MTGSEATAFESNPRLAYATREHLLASPRPMAPIPVSRIEGDAVIPEDDDPWFDDEDLDEDGVRPEPKRPFWNR